MEWCRILPSRVAVGLTVNISNRPVALWPSMQRNPLLPEVRSVVLVPLVAGRFVVKLINRARPSALLRQLNIVIRVSTLTAS